MIIKSLDIENFRNIERAKLVFDKGVNLIYGDNAQGKTNALEALWLFTAAKSFRAAKDRDFVRFSCKKASLDLVFEKERREMTARLEFFEEGGRKASLCGVELAKSSELLGHVQAVIFSPEHLGLVKGGPDMRRRFIDTALLQVKPRYFAAAMSFKRVLMQRNALLKDINRFPQLAETLDVWNTRFYDAAAAMTAMRRDYIEKLKLHAAQTYADICGGLERMEIIYKPSHYGFDGGFAEIRKRIEQAAQKLAPQEIAAGTSIIGPHRDELEILINGRPARLYGSQGQQRSAVLALKIAEGECCREITGEHPLLLLDDVLSELDLTRQDYILNRLKGAQVVITCCEKEKFSKLISGKAFHVSNGVFEG